MRFCLSFPSAMAIRSATLGFSATIRTVIRYAGRSALHGTLSLCGPPGPECWPCRWCRFRGLFDAGLRDEPGVYHPHYYGYSHRRVESGARASVYKHDYRYYRERNRKHGHCEFRSVLHAIGVVTGIVWVIFITLIAALITSFSQLLFKKGINKRLSSLKEMLGLARNWLVVAGVIGYVAGLAVYLVALSKAPLSVVYPVFASTFVFVAVIS